VSRRIARRRRFPLQQQRAQAAIGVVDQQALRRLHARLQHAVLLGLVAHIRGEEGIGEDGVDDLILILRAEGRRAVLGGQLW